MPRYFFSCEGAQTFEDAEGTELPDLATARLQAIEQAGDLMRDYPDAFDSIGWWRMTITDASGAELAEVSFELRPPGREEGGRT